MAPSEWISCAGCCFAIGGSKYKTQTFNTTINKASSSLLLLAAIAISIPTAAPALYSIQNLPLSAVFNISHSTAIVLIVL